MIKIPTGAEYVNITAEEALVDPGYANIKEFAAIIDWSYEVEKHDTKSRN